MPSTRILTACLLPMVLLSPTALAEKQPIVDGNRGKPDNQKFQKLLDQIPKENLHEALHVVQPALKDDLFKGDRPAAEAVHGTNPALASTVVEKAAKLKALRKRQEDAAGTPTAPQPSSYTPTPTDTATSTPTDTTSPSDTSDSDSPTSSTPDSPYPGPTGGDDEPSNPDDNDTDTPPSNLDDSSDGPPSSGDDTDTSGSDDSGSSSDSSGGGSGSSEPSDSSSPTADDGSTNEPTATDDSGDSPTSSPDSDEDYYTSYESYGATSSPLPTAGPRISGGRNRNGGSDVTTTDRYGNTITLSDADAGDVFTLTDSDGNVITTTYGANRKPISSLVVQTRTLPNGERSTLTSVAVIVPTGDSEGSPNAAGETASSSPAPGLVSGNDGVMSRNVGSGLVALVAVAAGFALLL